jgi:hypothetical protein
LPCRAPFAGCAERRGLSRQFSTAEIHTLIWEKHIRAEKAMQDAVIPVIYVDGMYVFLPIVSRRP